MPTYSLDELISWADAQPELPGIWAAYQNSGHDKWLAPSVDRKNSNLPYTLDNLELVTWEENSRRGYKDTKSGFKMTQHKAVASLNPDGSILRIYSSLHEAARDVGGSPSNIQRVADTAIIRKPDGRTTVLKSSKGFGWKWVKPTTFT